MADKRISQLVERVDIANNDVLPIVASGATTTNKVTISSIQTFMQGNLDLGVTSVGLSMPSAFSVTNSPVTGTGNISVTGAGTTAQYIRGDGSLADFPASSGGGSSVSYYLNGSVSQGTIGGVDYQELSKVPILGAGTDFTINANGYIASFITDIFEPNLLEIPGGNWNFETYFQASSGGGSPTFYVELYKVSYPTGTATLIASNSGTPELIANAPAFNLQVNGSLRNINASNAVAASFGGGTSTPSVVGIGTINSGALPFIQGYNNAISGTASLSINPSGGNVLIGTATDAGFRLDVNGSTRFNGLSTIQGTTASDSGQLGAELLTTGTGDASWTGTSFATGYTHVAGSTTTLTSTLAGVANTFYQITYTVSGRTAGSFTIGFGGVTSGSIASTGAIGPQATTTGTLVISPTTDFNGTIVLSIRTISASSASVTFNSSAATSTNTIRISSLDSNTFVGLNTGQRNTTGVANTFIGSAAGQANTTGIDNSFFGRTSGISNTTGASNSFYGRSSGQSNISGSENSFFGRNSGLFNTTGGFNSFFGASSGAANTTGTSNSFFGTSAGAANTTATGNSFFGISSGQANTTGNNNSFFGRGAGVSITGSTNSFYGHNSGFSLLTGDNNTLVGTEAGRYTGSGTTAMTSVNNSIYLGYQTRGLNATGSTNEVVIGYNVVGLGSNTTVLGNTSTTFGRWYGSLLLGTTTNAASSILTMESTTQGFLPPRMTTTQKNAIASPATGLVVYDTTLNKLAVYTGAAWETITSV